MANTTICEHYYPWRKLPLDVTIMIVFFFTCLDFKTFEHNNKNKSLQTQSVWSRCFLNNCRNSADSILPCWVRNPGSRASALVFATSTCTTNKHPREVLHLSSSLRPSAEEKISALNPTSFLLSYTHNQTIAKMSLVVQEDGSFQHILRYVLH